MNKIKVFKIKLFVSLLIIVVPLLVGLSVIIPANLVQAADTPPQSINFQPQITLPIKPFNQTSIPVGEYVTKTQGNQTVGLMKSNLLAEYIKALYDYGLMIGGILAAVVLMGGGVLWLISAGNDSKIMQAKELITGSIVGLIILFGSWVILDTINPNLTVLPSINTQVISTETYGSCCQYPNYTAKDNVPESDCTMNKGTYFPVGKALINNNGYGHCADSGSCYCKIGGSWNTLWISNSNCVDGVTPSACEAACSTAAKNINTNAGTIEAAWQKHFEWAKKCKAVPGGAGSSW